MEQAEKILEEFESKKRERVVDAKKVLKELEEELEDIPTKIKELREEYGV